MTYPTSFTPEQQAILREILPSIEGLRPGGTAIVEHANAKELERRRYLFYAWLSPFHSNRKELYSVKSINSNSFVVIHKDMSKATVRVQENECELFVMENLLDVVSDEAALAIIRSKCSNAAAQEKIFQEWKRING